MKNDHLSALDLSLGVHTDETNLRGKSGAKRKQSKGENSAAPFQENSSDFHAILSPFQVCIMSMKCLRSNPK